MRILLIEDDVKAARLLARGLGEEGFVVDVAHSAEVADELAFVTVYDLIVLDWLLPAKDGLTFCGDLRRRGAATPILMLTARDALADRIRGLNAGADDYLTKPFAFEELLARSRALLRRSELTRPPVLRVGELSLDPHSHAVRRGASVLDLTPKEYAILEILLRQAGEVVSRSRLAEQVWRADLIAIDNLIDVHISKLRRKVDGPGQPALIRTVRGRGFMLTSPAVARADAGAGMGAGAGGGAGEGAGAGASAGAGAGAGAGAEAGIDADSGTEAGANAAAAPDA